MAVEADDRDVGVAEEEPVADEGEGEGYDTAKPDLDGDIDEGSEADAEVAEELDDDDGGEFVGAVKTRTMRPRRGKKVEDESEAGAGEDAEDAGTEDGEDSDKSGVEEDWEAADDGEELEIANPNANLCV